MAKRVLIVDDEQTILNLLQDMLQLSGFLADVASSKEDAERMLQDTDYHVVITDLRLTSSQTNEGLEIISHVKAHYPKTHVVIMTGYGGPAIQQDAYDRGAAFYFSKPFSLHTIRDALVTLYAQSTRPTGEHPKLLLEDDKT